ncbi:MAG: iron-containing alcohol dehydrogenase family protein [Algibacter sp.]|uniref:iron-containing alcohol dehydrogenase family protein n=1 Tax=Algibacter sp. TaxID=1872428 RepID=UPI002602DD23|nr:iron-containing alcohol dehydrogenase family protein [Algibacter sp.]MDG1729548.1 iron-containing alcohol dehydrogenase family protein [Algibacter sp.]MDG2177708.1 iron-containing alcohol dehydrogenase family protein [Algibacter sp.]
MGYKNFPMVPRVIFGRGSFNQINEVLALKRLSINAPFIFLVDDVFRNNPNITSILSLSYDDRIIYVSAKEEPKTSQVDQLVEDIILKSKQRPSGIIGIGGGTVLDLAKAVAIMLTNEGGAKDYQGWDLVKNPAIYHVGIPTISGTGSEVSRTTVLTGPERKLGINSDYTPFDQVILDSELTKELPRDQWFYTGMDCYIHCIESLTGTYLNTFSETYGNMALDLCKEIFLDGNLTEIEARDKLMMASWHGGMSIAYSQVGIAHAMSYGLSYLLGTKHGIGNCIVFDHLEDYYPEGVKVFKQMKAKHNITLPQGICADLADREFDIMINVALSLDPLWENAIGKNWKKIITREKLRTLYQKM